MAPPPRDRAFVPAVVGLAGGLLIGLWQPRGEILGLRAEVEELRDRAERGCAEEGAAARIRGLLGAPAAGRRAPPAPVPPTEDPVAAKDGGRQEVPATPPGAPVGGPEDGAASPSPEEMARMMEDAMRVRRRQARAALVEQAELEEDDLVRVDAAVERMNEELAGMVEDLVEDATASGRLDRRELMAFAADALEVVISADGALRDVVGDEAVASVDDTALDPLSYLDAAVVAPLTRLEGVASPYGR
ncbi:hypothetical protein L6R50_19150 [Myxococcota bacterium]|nr:hypothetical protein [Myxococcota bacterium]